MSYQSSGTDFDLVTPSATLNPLSIARATPGTRVLL